MDTSRDPLMVDDEAPLAVASISRRRLLTAGGCCVATAALIAACGPDQPKGQVPQAGLAPTTTAVPEQVINNAVLLRTASSLEHSLVNAYTKLLATPGLKADAASLGQLFQSQHTEHATYFEGLTTDAGGKPFTSSNAAFDANVIEPGLAFIQKSGNESDDIIMFLYAIETAAAGTYQSFIPTFSTPNFRSSIMTVGGIEARHSAVFAKLVPNSTLAPPIPGAPVPTTTTTSTTQSKGPTTTAPNPPPPVYVVPGPFGQLTATPIVIGHTAYSVDILGPNSFEYESA
jgi:hypothetical protein